MVELTLSDRLKLARTALVRAEKNSRDESKNHAYWLTQIAQESKLIQDLEAQLREAGNQPA